jgi:hypothetical protein
MDLAYTWLGTGASLRSLRLRVVARWPGRRARSVCHPGGRESLEHGECPGTGRYQMPEAREGLDQEPGGRRQED